MNHLSTLLLLLLSIFFVGYQSEVYLLAVPAALAAIWVFTRVGAGKTAVLRKSILYAAIVPFSLWWVLSPSVEGRLSPWLFYIPAWYCIFLALMQWRSVGRGGELVFVRFNTLAALLFAIRNPDRFAMAIACLFLFVFLWHIRPRGPFFKWFISFAAAMLFAVFFVFASITIKTSQEKKLSKNWGEDFYWNRHMLGFDPVASLGSFEKNFDPKYNDQIVLRLWTSSPPVYLKAVAYERYIQGLWKVSSDLDVLYPTRYQIDYAVFKSELASDSAVWVQSALNTFQYLFAPQGASGVAVKAADSVQYFKGGVWQALGVDRSDWYYFKGSVLDTSAAALFLKVADRDKALVERASLAMGLDTLSTTLEKVKRIRFYFAENFEYSLYLPIKKRDDLLDVFWESRLGYCEYFATLATLLLRHHKIPARYVVGFAFPEFSSSSQYAFFRRRNSHSWVEYFDGHWKITDPTPIVAIDVEKAGLIKEIQEGFRARSAYVLHLIKEGSWRQKIDVLQVITEKWLHSFWFYFILVAVLAVIFVLKRRQKITTKYIPDARALEWRVKLNRVFRLLQRMGYYRKPGETIGHFILRLELLRAPNKNDTFEKQLRMLKKYQKERWRKASRD